MQNLKSPKLGTPALKYLKSWILNNKSFSPVLFVPASPAKRAVHLLFNNTSLSFLQIAIVSIIRPPIARIAIVVIMGGAVDLLDKIHSL